VVLRNGTETDYRFPAQLRELVTSCWIFDPWMWDPIGCPETSVRNYCCRLRNSSEERISDSRTRSTRNAAELLRKTFGY